jgi:hypothetical protein
MDSEHVKGVADKAKGTIKEGAGKLSGTRTYKGKARPTRPRALCTMPQVMLRMRPGTQQTP